MQENKLIVVGGGREMLLEFSRAVEGGSFSKWGWEMLDEKEDDRRKRMQQSFPLLDFVLVLSSSRSLNVHRVLWVKTSCYENLQGDESCYGIILVHKRIELWQPTLVGLRMQALKCLWWEENTNLLSFFEKIKSKFTWKRIDERGYKVRLFQNKVRSN